jgi:tetratricopeptide (TPR) repeat protein
MASLICGRCGHRTAPNSTYCSTCHWTIYVDAPDTTGIANTPPVLAQAQLPAHGGFIARRRQESERSNLESELRALLDAQIAEAEEQLEANPDDAALQRHMGLIALLDGALERANAHFERAHALAPHDLETHVNYGITLARRGQYQPALTLLEEARQKWPGRPATLFNLALAALGARRPQVVLDAVQELEELWRETPAIAADYHDEAMTARGLALLLENKNHEAHAALQAAAQRQVNLDTEEDEPTDPQTPEAEGAATLEYVPFKKEGEATTLQLEGEADADLLNNLAIAEAALGRTAQAAARLAVALRLDPAHTPALNNLGVLSYGFGQYQAALKYLQTAHRIEEESGQREPATFNHLGVTLSALGRLDEALEQFEFAGSHERAEFEVFYNLGRAYIERGQPDKGIAHLRHAFELEPNHADLHALLGAAYLLRGRVNLLPEALKHLKRALQLNSRHATAFANLIMALRESGDQNATIRALQSAVKSFPDHPAILFQLAIATALQGGNDDWGKAGTQFGHIFNRRSDLTAALFNEALCQYLMGLRDLASKQLTRAVERDSAFAPAYYLIGMGHAAANRLDEALAAWENALKYEPTNVDVLANIGYVYFHKENFRLAIKYFMQAHQILPAHAGLLASLGLAFARAGMLAQAITAFQHSLKLNTRAPITHSNLGLAYYLFKKVDKAMEQWRIVSQLDSGYASRREEEQYRVYDNSLVEIQPLDWPRRFIHLSPPLPRPHTRLLPGYNARTYRPIVNDPALQKAAAMKQEIERQSRLVAALGVR